MKSSINSHVKLSITSQLIFSEINVTYHFYRPFDTGKYYANTFNQMCEKYLMF